MLKNAERKGKERRISLFTELESQRILACCAERNDVRHQTRTATSKDLLHSTANKQGGPVTGGRGVDLDEGRAWPASSSLSLTSLLEKDLLARAR